MSWLPQVRLRLPHAREAVATGPFRSPCAEIDAIVLPSTEPPKDEDENPYAPPSMPGLERHLGTGFESRPGWACWLLAAVLTLACGVLAAFLPVAGLLGVLLVGFATVRVHRMLKRGPGRLLIHNSVYLFGSSLVVVTLVAVAAGISYSAMATTVAILEPDRQSQFFPVILGVFAFTAVYLYLYRVSVFMPF